MAWARERVEVAIAAARGGMEREPTATVMTFPEEKEKDIMMMLRELSIDAPDDLLSNPDQESVTLVYKKFIHILTGESPEVRRTTETTVLPPRLWRAAER